MNRATGTNMNPIMLGNAFRHSVLATAPCASCWQFCAVLMYFQVGLVWMYMDFRVVRNNCSILATDIDPVTAPRSGTVTANQPQCTAKALACTVDKD